MAVTALEHANLIKDAKDATDLTREELAREKEVVRQLKEQKEQDKQEYESTITSTKDELANEKEAVR